MVKSNLSILTKPPSLGASASCWTGIAGWPVWRFGLPPGLASAAAHEGINSYACSNGFPSLIIGVTREPGGGIALPSGCIGSAFRPPFGKA